MARKNGDIDPERSKIRVFYAEAEGTTQSIQDLLRSLSAAMSRPVQMQPRLTQVNASPSNGQPAGAMDAEVIESAVEEPSTEPVDQPGTQPRRKRGEGTSNRDRNAGLAIVKSLNLMPEGKESLKAFLNRKKPQNQMEHIAVYIYYLKSIAEESKIGFSHIYSCFKNSGERLPMDLPQTCRNAGSSKGWIDTADQDDLKTTTAGANFVEHELPHAAAEK